MPRPPASAKNSRNKGSKSPENAAPAFDETAPPPASAAPQAVEVFIDTAAARDNDSPAPNRRRRKAAGPSAEEGEPVRAIQPPLFSLTARGELIQQNADIPALTASSPLSVARWWFKSHLEQLNRPSNTVKSYMYDLSGFEEIVTDKPIEQINREDVGEFLSQSKQKSTRKRRLTSLGSFFKYLIVTEKVLTRDPTDNFMADFIPLKTPTVLDKPEQERLLEAAARENSRTYLMIYFMVKLGFTRTELLAVRPDHVDIGDPQNPVVYVFYDEQRWKKKERKLAADPAFVEAYQRYITEFQPQRRLFEMLPQSVNKLVERVAKEAGFDPKKKKVTPQSLRDSFAVEEARSGANSSKLLLILGLAPDPRNRMSVDRYVRLATPVSLLDSKAAPELAGRVASPN